MAIPEQTERKKKKTTSSKLPDQSGKTEKVEKRRKKSEKKRQKEFPGHNEDENYRNTVMGIEEDTRRAKKKKKKHSLADEFSGNKLKLEKPKKNIITDERFASAQSDPRFQRIPQRDVKVSIDDRFSRRLSEKEFAPSSAPVDKRGKKRKSKADNSLSRYYIREEEKSDVLENFEKEKRESAGLEEDSDPSKEEEKHADAPPIDSETTSASEDDEDGNYQYGEESDGWQLWMVNQEEAPMVEEATRRIAVVNLDWDHIKAVDIYVMMSTTLLTCPQSGGQVLSVSIYPSEFGLKCMEIEAVRGPHALIDGGDENHDEKDDSDDDDKVNAKIRSYQIQRLRYYYAVVECDSSATANHLYNALDGVEFLRSANVLDLRFVPDSMIFFHSPRDVACEAPTDYQQPDFETTALQHSSVKLTWDDDEPKRKKILRRKFNADQMDELEQYLASEDSEEEEGEEQDKYHFLLHDDDGNDDSGDDDDDEDGKKEMEVTFLPGVENLSKHIEKSKLKKSEESVWAAALRKKREKNKSRKFTDDDDNHDDSSDDNEMEIPDGNDDDDDFFAEDGGQAVRVSKKDQRKGRGKPEEVVEGEASTAELELLLANEDAAEGDHLKGFNLRPKNNKKDMSVAVDKLPEVDAAADPRFLSRLSSSLYSLDPTDPNFKRSATGMRQEHSKKQVKKESPNEDKKEGLSLAEEKPGKEKHEIMSLVRSLKMKSQVLRENTRKR